MSPIDVLVCMCVYRHGYCNISFVLFADGVRVFVCIRVPACEFHSTSTVADAVTAPVAAGELSTAGTASLTAYPSVAISGPSRVNQDSELLTAAAAGRTHAIVVHSLLLSPLSTLS